MNFSSWFNYGSLNMYRHKFKKYLSNIHTPFIIICSILPHLFSLCLTFVLNRLNIYFISTLLCLNMCLQITKAFPDNHFPTYSVSWQWLPIDLVMFLVLFGTASVPGYFQTLDPPTSVSGMLGIQAAKYHYVQLFLLFLFQVILDIEQSLVHASHPSLLISPWYLLALFREEDSFPHIFRCFFF